MKSSVAISAATLASKFRMNQDIYNFLTKDGI